MNKKKVFVFILISFLVIDVLAWGFYGHRLINRKAIYSLPVELFGFYKANIDYLGYHAVDPDKRRYSVNNEAPKHYIDLDRYLQCINCSLDSIRTKLPIYWSTEVDSLYRDSLSNGGLLPWNLAFQVRLLSLAFENKKTKEILRLSAEIGHYASDAHVPLHTTENYNGQMTNQHGIHALWESKIPERFGPGYDFLKGPALYLENVQLSIWKVIIESHKLVASVLKLENELRSDISSDRIFSASSKGRQTVIGFSEEYIDSYENLVGKSVEQRMTSSSHFIASLWYTAWVNAGQPNLSDLDKSDCQINLESRKKNSSKELEPEHKH